MAITKKDLLELREKILAQLAWVDAKIKEFDLESDKGTSDSETTESTVKESSPDIPQKPNQTIPPHPEEETAIPFDIESKLSESREPFSKTGCLLIVFVFIVLFLAAFWILPNMLYD